MNLKTSFQGCLAVERCREPEAPATQLLPRSSAKTSAWTAVDGSKVLQGSQSAHLQLSLWA